LLDISRNIFAGTLEITGASPVEKNIAWWTANSWQ